MNISGKWLTFGVGEPAYFSSVDFFPNGGGVVVRCVRGDVVVQVAALAQGVVCFAGAGEEGAVPEQDARYGAVVDGREVVVERHAGGEVAEGGHDAA